MKQSRTAWVLAGAAAVAIHLVDLRSAAAQGQFGGQDRADAARQAIVLAVQQAIDSLPPASGQAFSYEYDAAKGTFVRSSLLGPSALRSTRLVGDGRFDIRVSASYFDISESLGPVTYEVELADPRQSLGFAKLGLDASASVGVIAIAASYGFTASLEGFVTIPITVVDAQASQSFTTRAGTLGLPPAEAPLSGARTREDLEAGIRAGDLVYRRESFRALGFDFNQGTHAGLGRITLGGRWVAFASPRVRLAIAPELFLPSPSEDEFAGPDSTAILPRVIGEFAANPHLRLLADAGYEYDFGEASLRRFTGTGGVLVAYERYSVDMGLSGSVFDQPITWTPDVAYGAASGGFPATVLTVQEGNDLGGSFLDFVFGIKVLLADDLALSGVVTVPLNEQPFRPVAFGTIGLELSL